ncbi:3-isopropylmalate dehydrogenase [Parasynechococcus marenigrum]|uniref:3-isopropylmalate dehydrogenase n=1 Tax=Parasynechococcus marenigrum (strain WH8102) TaxID=84588 RepID=LEU3_PARMW|nr:3-isopropylmalate dehydrogenase [Parasynechococcus marenigrum]Q7U840.1 RecName: Full=3-isopropylmalate dehydrogenase; AltName: Full=3-IPM-DH; AltName: Full=Beta-IPM dehydrogenase; Short=IMDH [Parasynechococcus marenigrum WH 8102]CAE07299.1 3-isopropylmalate dehydrogenase [Parasynechococcus marenigrum WH 8102]
MAQHRVVLLPGDGIGPEITAVARQLLEAVSQRHGFELCFDGQLIGGSAIDACGEPLPASTLDACKAADAVLLAAIGSPRFDNLPRDKRPETGLLGLRSGMALFANLRPVKIVPALIGASSLRPEVIEGVDLMVVRELTGGIYFGQPKGRIQADGEERGFNTMTYSSSEVDRIARVAFDLARERRGNLCSVDKANVLDVSQLWRDRVDAMAPAYSDVEVSHMYVDNAAMQLVRSPRQFDVLLTGNLFGDILSDEAAMLTGSIGMLPSASLGSDCPGLFEPVHGSAPDIAGQDKANPMAMVLSAAMMLRIGLKQTEAAADLEAAVDKVLAAGFRTGDLMAEGCTALGCRAMGDALLKAL